MRRAVVDANVFISAVIRPEGPPGLLLATLLDEPPGFSLVLTTETVEEIRRALDYPKVRKSLRRRAVNPQAWFDCIEFLADLVEPARLNAQVAPDPDDDKYLAAALGGLAAFVVTGDGKFLSVGEYQGVKLISPADFLKLLS